jgi:hypothetical protein
LPLASTTLDIRFAAFSSPDIPNRCRYLEKRYRVIQIKIYSHIDRDRHWASGSRHSALPTCLIDIDIQIEIYGCTDGCRYIDRDIESYR